VRSAAHKARNAMLGWLESALEAQRRPRRGGDSVPESRSAVGGYKVKVKYRIPSSGEEKTRKKRSFRVILKALRRLRGPND